jgi:hypothetical protein
MPVTDPKLLKQFADALNRHGHPFQNSIIALADALLSHGASNWKPEVMEFPVAIGLGTRIDLILLHCRTGVRFIVECKRVNTAYSCWLFAKARKVFRDLRDNFIAEQVRYEEGIFTANGLIVQGVPEPQFYQIAHQIRTPNKTKENGPNNDAIEDAATQVCRGMNGLVNFYQNHHEALKAHPTNERVLIPAIFTTADLYTTDIDLSESHSNTGTINPDLLTASQTPFLYYQYHLSPGIKHGAPPANTFQELAHTLAAEYVRTIPIVSASGIEAFLKLFELDNFGRKDIVPY